MSNPERINTMSKIVPIHDFILLEQIQSERKQIIDLSAAKDRTKMDMAQFRVEAIGPDVKHVKVGDQLVAAMVSKAALDGRDVFFVKEEAVCLVSRGK